MTPASEVLTQPFHPSLSIDGQDVHFPHLEPLQFQIGIQKPERVLTVDVRFSNHCYTEAFDATRHDASLRVMDGKMERAFCPERFALSGRLPAMVQALPDGAVWLTKHERNFVYFIIVEEDGWRYPMFFSLKRRGAGLAMFVESAYPVDKAQMDEIIRLAATRIRFPALCSKVFRGERVKLHIRR